MREKLLEKKLREKVKELGGVALKFYSSHYTGLPDRIVFLKGGQTAFAEIKTTGQKPTPRQKVVHALFRDLGYRVDVINSQETLDNFINYCKSHAE